MYGGAVARPIAGAIFFFGLFLKNLGLDLKFPINRVSRPKKTWANLARSRAGRLSRAWAKAALLTWNMKVGKWKQLAIPAHLICLFLPIAENAAAQLAGTVQRIMETHSACRSFRAPLMRIMRFIHHATKPAESQSGGVTRTSRLKHLGHLIPREWEMIWRERPRNEHWRPCWKKGWYIEPSGDHSRDGRKLGAVVTIWLSWNVWTVSHVMVVGYEKSVVDEGKPILFADTASSNA